jgi:uncharacterized protein (TIGR00730 family)
MKKPKIPKFINPKHYRVAIFGSARIKPNDTTYKQVYALAKMIAQEGIDVVTGGGPGLMEAANKGHQHARGGNMVRSFGLNIKLPKEQMANKHLDIKKEFARFSERLDYFMYLSNIVVVAPGGIGTLLEFMYTWQLVQVEQVCDTPIILLGKMWPPFLKWFKKWITNKEFIAKKDLHPIFLAENIQDAIKIIRMAHEDHKNGGPDVCNNYKKYRIKY